MSSIEEHTDELSSEAVLGRIRDDEHPSLFEVVVASADPGNRPVPARVSVMAAVEALLDYVSSGRTDNDRESTQWGSAGQSQASGLGDRSRLQIGAQLGAIFGGVNIIRNRQKEQCN